MNQPSTTADRLKHLHSLGHTQKAIAAACGLTQPTVSLYLSGKYRESRETTANRVVQGYRALVRKSTSKK